MIFIIIIIIIIIIIMAWTGYETDNCQKDIENGVWVTEQTSISPKKL